MVRSLREVHLNLGYVQTGRLRPHSRRHHGQQKNVPFASPLLSTSHVNVYTCWHGNHLFVVVEPYERTFRHTFTLSESDITTSLMILNKNNLLIIKKVS